MMTDSKGKGGKTKPKERKSVSFNPTVGVREYERRYNGSGGVPHMGGYPLGLGSTYVEKSEPIVTPKKLNARLESGHVFTVLTEKQRKKLLRKFDPSCPKNDSVNKLELKKLRLSRMVNSGCSCSFGRCNRETCDCYILGIPCNYGCRCSFCENPYNRPYCDEEEEEEEEEEDDDEEYVDDDDDDEDGDDDTDRVVLEDDDDAKSTEKEELDEEEMGDEDKDEDDKRPLKKKRKTNVKETKKTKTKATKKKSHNKRNKRMQRQRKIAATLFT